MDKWEVAPQDDSRRPRQMEHKARTYDSLTVVVDRQVVNERTTDGGPAEGHRWMDGHQA